MTFLMISATSSTGWTQNTSRGETDGCAQALIEADALIEKAKQNARAQERAKDKAEERRDDVIRDLEGVESERDACRGDVQRLEHLLATKPVPARNPMPTWIGVTLHVVSVAGSIVGGACLFNDCAATTTVSSFVVAAGAAVLDLTDLFWAFE